MLIEVPSSLIGQFIIDMACIPIFGVLSVSCMPVAKTTTATNIDSIAIFFTVPP
jgi:hypothetical protein